LYPTGRAKVRWPRHTKEERLHVHSTFFFFVFFGFLFHVVVPSTAGSERPLRRRRQSLPNGERAKERTHAAAYAALCTLCSSAVPFISQMKQANALACRRQLCACTFARAQGCRDGASSEMPEREQQQRGVFHTLPACAPGGIRRRRPHARAACSYAHPLTRSRPDLRSQRACRRWRCRRCP
jgi:hypothetical protein